MVSNYLVKCNICGRVCNLKYQLGFSKKHPIRYKCMCGFLFVENIEKRKE